MQVCGLSGQHSQMNVVCVCVACALDPTTCKVPSDESPVATPSTLAAGFYVFFFFTTMVQSGCTLHALEELVNAVKDRPHTWQTCGIKWHAAEVVVPSSVTPRACAAPRTHARTLARTHTLTQAAARCARIMHHLPALLRRCGICSPKTATGPGHTQNGKARRPGRSMRGHTSGAPGRTAHLYVAPAISLHQNRRLVHASPACSRRRRVFGRRRRARSARWGKIITGWPAQQHP